MRGSRMSWLGEPEEVCLEQPDPELRLSPLATPMGTASSYRAPDCRTCLERPDCMASVVRLGPFAVTECEMALRVKTLTGRANAFNDLVRAVLQEHPEGMVVTEIAAAVQRPHSSIQSALRCLERRQQVRIDRTQVNRYRYYPA